MNTTRVVVAAAFLLTAEASLAQFKCNPGVDKLAEAWGMCTRDGSQDSEAANDKPPPDDYGDDQDPVCEVLGTCEPALGDVSDWTPEDHATFEKLVERERVKNADPPLKDDPLGNALVGGAVSGAIGGGAEAVESVFTDLLLEIGLMNIEIREVPPRTEAEREAARMRLGLPPSASQSAPQPPAPVQP